MTWQHTPNKLLISKSGQQAPRPIEATSFLISSSCKNGHLKKQETRFTVSSLKYLPRSASVSSISKNHTRVNPAGFNWRSPQSRCRRKTASGLDSSNETLRDTADFAQGAQGQLLPDQNLTDLCHHVLVTLAVGHPKSCNDCYDSCRTPQPSPPTVALKKGSVLFFLR